MTHFIKLPDGTIINTAHVESIYHEASETGGWGITVINSVMKYGAFNVDDPTGAIYSYFNSIAEPIVATEESIGVDNELGW